MREFILIVAAAVLVIGCRPVDVASQRSGADAPAAPSKDALKKAAAFILSCDCGHSVSDPGFPENAKLLADAGPAIVPVLVEMLADDARSTWFVSSAAHRASTFPFSEPFRDALRRRRDDKRFDQDSGAMLGVYEYFAREGDDADLLWMERSLSRLDDRRNSAAKSVQKLRERLPRK